MDNTTNKHEFACNAGKVTEYEVKEHIDTIMVGFRGFSKEVSIVKWNDKKPVFDIRAWRVSDRDGLQYPLRGITFSKEELIKLREILNSIDVNCIDEYMWAKAYGANTAFLLDGTEDTAPTVIRIVPYGKENEDWDEDDWEEEWNNAPDENEVDE